MLSLVHVMQMKLLAIITIINRHEISLALLPSTPWFSDYIELANSYAFPWWEGAHGAPKGTATTQPDMSPLRHAGLIRVRALGAGDSTDAAVLSSDPC